MLKEIHPVKSYKCTISIGRLCHIGHVFFKFSLILYNSERFATKFCYCIIRNYKQMLLLIRSIVLSLHTKKILRQCRPNYYMGKEEWKYLIFSGVQRHNYCSDFKLSLYVVTYYKFTSLYHIFVFPSNVRENSRKPCPIWHEKVLYLFVIGVRHSVCIMLRRDVTSWRVLIHIALLKEPVDVVQVLAGERDGRVLPLYPSRDGPCGVIG